MGFAGQVDAADREECGNPPFRLHPAGRLESDTSQGASQLQAIDDGTVVLFVRSNKGMRSLLSTRCIEHLHGHGRAFHVASPSFLPHA